jgi:RNA polymerase sigma-70 factor (ECF subfamily)
MDCAWAERGWVVWVAAEPEPPGEPPAAPGFEERFRPCAAPVASLCRRLLGDGAGEDAAHEVFLRGQRGFAGYDPALPFRGWILGIAGNLCIDLLRRRAREQRLFDAGELDPAELSHPGPSPLSQALAAERRDALLAAIDALPLAQRAPLVLRYFQDLEYAAIAEILDITINQVGVLLFRARRRLREQLGGRER